MVYLHQIIWYLGWFALLKLSFLAFTTLYKRVIRPPANLSTYGANTGAWAVVTGASFGIGKSYAFELAKRGFNVLLISRNKNSLQEVAKEIESKHKVKTEVLAVDFSSHDPAIYTEIKGTLQALKDIAILVNNVGVSYPYPTKFLDITDELQDQILTINIQALTQMTRTVLPFMLRKKRGAIINLSSYSGVVPAPLLAIYSGSKAYVDHFSICLEYEYKSEGITVQSVTPGLTVSNMSKLKYASVAKGVCMPETIAKGSLDNLGREFRWSPWWMHALIEYLTDQVLPLRFVMQKLTSISVDTRRRALQKEEREKKDKDKVQ